MSAPSVDPVSARERSKVLGSIRANLFTAADRRRLDPELLVPSRIRGYAQVIGNIGIFVGLLTLAGAAHSAYRLLALYPAIGFALHRLFFPVHDCIHYSLLPTKAENRVCGVILAALLGTSFEAIRDQHMDHHRDFGTPQDPGASDYYLHFRSRRELLVFLLGPLVGTILIGKIGDYFLRPSRATAQPSLRAAGATSNLSSKLMGYGAILCVQVVVCALLTRGFEPGRLWRYPVFNVLPAVTIFLFLVRLRMFLEHGSLNYAVCDYFEHKRPTARTIYGSLLERVLLCGSDFNFHHEHHLYPVVPGWKLPELHRQLLTSGLDPEDVRPTYLRAFREIWRNLSGQSRPAVGAASQKMG